MLLLKSTVSWLFDCELCMSGSVDLRSRYIVQVPVDERVYAVNCRRNLNFQEVSRE